MKLAMLTLSMLAVAPAVAAPIAATAVPAATPLTAIDAAMADSAAGWNTGSLERFVAIYARDATFVGKDGLVQGRPAIAARYRPSFAGGANVRGKLSFQTLGHRDLGKVHFLLFARWTLTPADSAAKPETGMTTLLFERRPDGWKIVADHSS